MLLALAGVLLDLAVQCHQVMSQQEIYALRGDARARINTVYMTTVFVGGAISSAMAGVLRLGVRLDGRVLVRRRLAAAGIGAVDSRGFVRARASEDTAR